jgi:hypothetical protein
MTTITERGCSYIHTCSRSIRPVYAGRHTIPSSPYDDTQHTAQSRLCPKRSVREHSVLLQPPHAGQAQISWPTWRHSPIMMRSSFRNTLPGRSSVAGPNAIPHGRYVRPLVLFMKLSYVGVIWQAGPEMRWLHSFWSAFETGSTRPCLSFCRSFALRP